MFCCLHSDLPSQYLSPALKPALSSPQAAAASGPWPENSPEHVTAHAMHVWEEGGNPAPPLPYFPPHKCWASFWDVPVGLLPLAGVNVPGQGWKAKASAHLMFPGSQTKAVMICAGLGFKSLSALIRPSSQTHTERLRVSVT